MAHPATEKRGGSPDVKHEAERQKPKDPIERKLEQGLEESMTGSDPRQCRSTGKDQAGRKERGLGQVVQPSASTGAKKSWRIMNRTLAQCAAATYMLEHQS
jgi:hypothetical protein